MSKAIDIIKLLVDGKPVIDKDNNILYLHGFILGSETANINSSIDFDFDELETLKPHISKEILEIEKLKRQLKAESESTLKQGAIIKELTKQLNEANIDKIDDKPIVNK